MNQCQLDSHMLMRGVNACGLIMATGMNVMTDINGRIEELEVKAAESALIADLTTDWEVRTYNSRLAQDLREAANTLRRCTRVVEGRMQ